MHSNGPTSPRSLACVCTKSARHSASDPSCPPSGAFRRPTASTLHPIHRALALSRTVWRLSKDTRTRYSSDLTYRHTDRHSSGSRHGTESAGHLEGMFGDEAGSEDLADKVVCNDGLGGSPSGRCPAIHAPAPRLAEQRIEVSDLHGESDPSCPHCLGSLKRRV